MGKAKRLHREAVIAGIEPPIVHSREVRKARVWVCAHCHKPLIRGSGVTSGGFEYHIGCPKVMKPLGR